MTFARLAKLLAVLLVVAALWHARAPAAPARVAILALPGAEMELLATTGVRPGGITTAATTTGTAFWRGLLSIHDDEDGNPARSQPIWSVEPAIVRAFAVPARLFTDAERGGAVESSFLGSSSGQLVEAADLSAGRLPAPYDRAIDAVVNAAATLRPEEWSEWIRVRGQAGSQPSAPGPTAEFQFARYSDTTYYFSPAYLRFSSGIVGSGFLRGLDRGLRPLVAQHTLTLAARRLEASKGAFASVADARPVLMFDTVAEDAAMVFSPDSMTSAILDQIGVAIAAQVTALRSAVGAGGVILVIGGPSTTRQAGPAPWYAIIEGNVDSGGGSGARAPIDFDTSRLVVRYVVGVSLDAREKALLPGDLVSRFPIRATLARATDRADSVPPQQGWSAETLGSLRGALGSRN